MPIASYIIIIIANRTVTVSIFCFFIQIDYNYGIDLDGQIADSESETVSVENIPTLISEMHLAELEEIFTTEYILASEHYATDRFEELLLHVQTPPVP